MSVLKDILDKGQESKEEKPEEKEKKEDKPSAPEAAVEPGTGPAPPPAA